MGNSKYHVALSFAGEDRGYVDEVAIHLKNSDILVFYDKFDELNLWGKDLYSHLREIYQKRAYYTIIFISKHYKNKLWTNHERESAQARAFEESREYILPARFDDTEIPGILPTTGYVNLNRKTPEEFALLIKKKLEDAGVELIPDSLFDFSDEALADVDFKLYGEKPILEIIKQLKTNNWHKQNPAIDKLSTINLDTLSNDQSFVLGRNIYQCACGNVNNAVYFVENLRRSLSRFPDDVAQCVLAGIFYEIYFNSEGEFRKNNIKGKHLDNVFKVQTVKKYNKCIKFIQKELEPYKDCLAVTPNNLPININLELSATKTSPHKIRKLKFKNQNMIVSVDDVDEDTSARMWRLSFGKFTLERLSENISKGCFVPEKQLTISSNIEFDDDDLFILPKNKTISCPFGCSVDG